MKVLVIFLLLFMVSLYVFIPTSFAESTYVCQEYDPEITVIPNKEIFYPQENMTLKIIGQPNKTTEIIIENPKTKLFSDTVKTDLTGNATFTYPFEQHPMKGTWKIIANQDANVDILFLGMYDKPQRVLTVHANALMHSKFHTATFTIAGNPEQMLDLDVVNPMKQTVFHDKLILDSNGMCVYSMPLEGLSAGVYDFAISDNLVFASASFAVGLQPYDSALETISEPTKHDVLRPEQNGLLASPLDQLENGIPYNEIQCKQNLILIQKYDGSPACVTESTKTKLIERGWTESLPPCTSDRTACFNQESNICDPSGWDCGNEEVFSEIIPLPETNPMTLKQIAIKEIQDKIMSTSSHDEWRQEIQKQVDEKNLEPFSFVFLQDMKHELNENEKVSFNLVNFGYRNWCLMPSISVYHEDYDLPVYEGAIVHTCPSPMDDPVPRISVFDEQDFRTFPSCQFEGTYTIWVESFKFDSQIVGSFYCNSVEKFTAPKTFEVTIPQGSSNSDIKSNFTPSEINMKYGDYLKIINHDDKVHEVVLFIDKQSGAGVFMLRVNPNDSFTEPIRNLGTFELISRDKNAEEYSWMHGIVTVKEN